MTLHAGLSRVSPSRVYYGEDNEETGYVAELGFIGLGKSGWGGGVQFAVHEFASGWGTTGDVVVRYGYRPLFVHAAIGYQLYCSEVWRNRKDLLSFAMGGGVYINKYLGLCAQYRRGVNATCVTFGVTVLAGDESSE